MYISVHWNEADLPSVKSTGLGHKGGEGAQMTVAVFLALPLSTAGPQASR